MEKIAISCILEVYPNVDALSTWQQQLLQAATKALDSAYAPYSQFRVGAALLMDDDSIVTGSNQENAAYPSGLCAERVAFLFARYQQLTSLLPAPAKRPATRRAKAKN